jgi:hypothetical protein
VKAIDVTKNTINPPVNADVEQNSSARKQRNAEIKALAEILHTQGGGEWEDALQEAARIYAEDEAKERGLTAPEFRQVSNATEAGDGAFSLSLGLLHTLVGGELTSDGQIHARGPGHSKEDRSMCVTPSTTIADGYCVHSFSPRTSDLDCKSYIDYLFREWIKLQDAAMANGDDLSIPEIPVEAKSEENRVMSARRKWNRASGVLGQSAYEYLASRCLQLPADIAKRIAAFEAQGRWYCANGKYTDRNGRRYDDSELLIWACRDVFNDSGRAVQLVRLPHIGMKPTRKVRGLVKNAAIKLTKHEDVLAAGEVCRLPRDSRARLRR